MHICFYSFATELFEFYLETLCKSLDSDGILLFSVKGEYLSNLEGFLLDAGYHYEIYPVPDETHGRLSGNEYAVMCVNQTYVENICKKLGLRILENKEVSMRKL